MFYSLSSVVYCSFVAVRYCPLSVQLSHSVIDSLRGTERTWMAKLLNAFNAGSYVCMTSDRVIITNIYSDVLYQLIIGIYMLHRRSASF